VTITRGIKHRPFSSFLKKRIENSHQPTLRRGAPHAAMKFGLSDLGAPNMVALGALLAWLARRPTPIAWLVGPPGAGKTATVRAAFGTDAAPLADRLNILALDPGAWRG
jgi:hypothetical protein